MSNALVIVPTYNEKENVEKMILKVMSLDPQFDLLIIDDGSPDGTASIVKRMMQQFKGRLFIEERQGKLGLGTAYIHGFKWALERDYAFICEMDCDFSHNPDDLKILKAACENGGDLAIGSRYIKGVNVVNWPMGRVLMSYFASKYVKVLTGMPINDATAGFKCYTRKVLEAIDFDQIHFKGYAFQIEMKFTAWMMKFKLVEEPIIFTDRQEGTSKMDTSIFREAFFGVIQMKFWSWFKKYPKIGKAS